MKSKTGKHIIAFLLVLICLPISLHGFETGKAGEYFEKSFTYESKGDYTSALNSVLRILQMENRNYTAALRAGWLSYMKGNYSDSIQYYQKAVNFTPGAIEAMLGIMLPLIASKKWNEAEKIAQIILKMDYYNYYANSRLAYILFSQKRYGEAEKQYRKILDYYPSDIEMKLGLAWTYYNMGRKKEAEKYFRDLLKVRRKNTSALFGIEKIESDRK